jgi:enoyl-CoA hydratase
VRAFGGGADLAAMSADPLNAFFTLKGARALATTMWYGRKPAIFVGEGDVVAGSLETALHASWFLVTRHARLGMPEVKRGLTLPFGAHALTFRAGRAVAQRLMTTGELIDGAEAVRLGIADELVPDGVDPVAYALELAASPEFHDRALQTAILRQYGPPLGPLIDRSTRHYVRMLRDPATRRRVRDFLKERDDA